MGWCHDFDDGKIFQFELKTAARDVQLSRQRLGLHELEFWLKIMWTLRQVRFEFTTFWIAPVTDKRFQFSAGFSPKPAFHGKYWCWVWPQKDTCVALPTHIYVNVNTSSFSEVAKWRCPEEELKQNPKRRSQMKIRNDRYSEAERVFQVSWTVEGLIYKKHQRSRILNTWENWVGWLVWSRATMRASAERLRADLTFWSQGLEEEWDLGTFKKMTWMHGWSWRLPRQSVGWNSVICQNQFSQHQKAAAKWGKILIR